MPGTPAETANASASTHTDARAYAGDSGRASRTALCRADASWVRDGAEDSDGGNVTRTAGWSPMRSDSWRVAASGTPPVRVPDTRTVVGVALDGSRPSSVTVLGSLAVAPKATWDPRIETRSTRAGTGVPVSPTATSLRPGLSRAGSTSTPSAYAPLTMVRPTSTCDHPRRRPGTYAADPVTRVGYRKGQNRRARPTSSTTRIPRRSWPLRLASPRVPSGDRVSRVPLPDATVGAVAVTVEGSVEGRDAVTPATFVTRNGIVVVVGPCSLTTSTVAPAASPASPPSRVSVVSLLPSVSLYVVLATARKALVGSVVTFSNGTTTCGGVACPKRRRTRPARRAPTSTDVPLAAAVKPVPSIGLSHVTLSISWSGRVEATVRTS